MTTSGTKTSVTPGAAHGSDKTEWRPLRTISDGSKIQLVSVKDPPIIRLTATQRAALTTGLGDSGYTWRGATQRIMSVKLVDNGLARHPNKMVGANRTLLTTPLGALVLRAEPSDTIWVHRLPELRTTRDVRAACICKICERLDKMLPKLEGIYAHVACMVARWGWIVLLELPEAELDKMTVQDFEFLGITVPALEAARTGRKQV